jgi:hypothetical protein
VTEQKPSKAARLKACVDERLQELADLAGQARIGEALQQYLAFLARFHCYSFHNVMLILAQCPHAQLVAGYRRWQEMGFQVRRGEKGIGILAPQPWQREVEDPDTGKVTVEDGIWFKAVSVFDVSQVGIPCPACSHLSPTGATHCKACGTSLEVSLPRPPAWASDGEQGAGLAARLQAYARSLGIEVEEGALPGGARGASRIGKVVLRKGLSPLGRAEALAHEVAHEIAHPEWVRLELPRAVREVEAEAVAYVVLTHFGLSPSGGPNYVALWDPDGAILRQRLGRIGAVARRIIEALEGMEQPAVLPGWPVPVQPQVAAAR